MSEKGTYVVDASCRKIRMTSCVWLYGGVQKTRIEK